MMRRPTTTQSQQLVTHHEKALRYGWHIETERGRDCFIVKARRVAVGGRCGAATELDGGIRIMRESFADALAHLLQVIVLETENATEAERAAARGLVITESERLFDHERQQEETV